jgi:hypothetical protein
MTDDASASDEEARSDQKQERRCRMRKRASAVSLSLGLVAFGGFVAGQTITLRDERAILQVIRRQDLGDRENVFTEDRIFFSGAYKRPFVGVDTGELITSPPYPVSDRLDRFQRSTTIPRRIEIAASGDLAYEFSDTEVRFEMTDGRQLVMPNATLRVWRKRQGEWKVAAQFSFPVEKN